MERVPEAEEPDLGGRWGRLVIWQWAVLLALVVYVPLGLNGYVLSYDMAWVPRLDLHRLELWGLGPNVPRGVPSDAVVAIVGSVLPAALVQRLVLLGIVVLAAAGAARLVADWPLVAALTTATFYAWNPYVAERLVLGQWPMLIAYAALPWLIAALRSPSGPRWGPATIALAATAMSPVGGLVGLVVGVSAAWGRGVVRLVFTAALVNAPWVVAGVLHASATTADADSFRAFDAQPEGHLGRWGAVLSLGGVWNRDVVPDSRLLWTTVVLVGAMGAVMLLGLVALARQNRGLLIALAVPAGLALALVVGTGVAPDALGRMAEAVPGGGLLRDGTRYLAMLAPLEAVAFGAGAHELARRIRRGDVRQGVAVLLILVPIVALPDLAWGVGGRLEAVDYPPGWQDARSVVAAADVDGDVLVLPFEAYRRPPWNDDRPVLDPAGRYFDRTTVTDDDLRVPGRTIGGEDPRSARLRSILADGADPEALARAGIGLVVLATDAAGAEEAARLVRGLESLPVLGSGLEVYTVPDARTSAVEVGDRRLMIAAWGAAGLALALGVYGAIRASIRSAVDRRRRAAGPSRRSATGRNSDS